jgi:hypothetical protein
MPPNPLNVLREGKGAKAVMSLADEVRAEMAAEKAAQRARGLGVAGEDFADPTVKPTMKFSEALGITGSEGKTLNFTEADRSRVAGTNMGGTGFSTLQHYSKPHKEAGVTWGFGGEKIAKRKIEQGGDPEKHVWTTYIGSPDQHKSNTIVVMDALKNVQAANKANLIHPEQIRLINQRLRELVNKKGNPLFPSDFDITDPQALNAATTFDRRAAISDTLMGVGVKRPMIAKDFKAANPNVKYQDPAQMESILRRETDPLHVGLPNYSVGPSLFTMEDSVYRPDLNIAFPAQTTGTDFGVMFEMPTMFEAAPEFIKKKGYKPNQTINARALSMGAPTQFVDEAYLTYLQKIGRKKGGLAKMAKGGAARGMKKLKGIYSEVETSMGKGKGAEFEQSASPLNIMREGIGQWTGKNLDVQLKDLEDQALSPAYQKAIEDSLKADRVRAAAGDKAAQARIPTFEKVLAQGLAMKQWVNSNLKNYVKKQMGSPNDPVRAQAEKGITHLKDNGQIWRGQVPKAETNRMRAGLPTLGLGQSAEAKAWETLSDNTLTSMLPEDVPLSLARGNDWIKDLPEDERVLFYTHGPELGFEKLVDNINERMDAGEIRPDQLNKVSVADAVKNVHDERVRKEDLAKKVMQSNAATKTHKEYPTGYKWVEISANKDSPLPEGWEQLPNGTYVNPQGQGSIHNPNYIALQEALEHEGDIMGHCVGNYCDDVYKEGTRILSLRDPKGESHATVQVIPEKLYPVEWFNKLPEAEQRAIEASGYMGYNVRNSPQFKEAQAKAFPRIKQIKGKQDEPLIGKYRPMMADLVNTGDYSYVDELHNAGMTEKGKVLTEYEEQWLKSKGYQVPKYVLKDDIDVMRRALYDNNVPSSPPEAGMAKGGAAKGAKAVMSLADQVKAEMAAEKQYGQISGMVSKMGEEGRSPIIPVPNRWFLQPDKFPHQQKLIERVLQQTGMNREDFPSGAFIDPRTGEVLDSRIMDDLGVVINPATNRPMMSAKGQSGLEALNPKTGAYTKSNLVRKGLFKPEGGDPLLNDLSFLATIEKGDVGHKYGLATEYASPTELWNTGTGANPTLRPRSRGDLFGVGDVVGQVRIGKSNPHDVYEKLFVAPKGSDVQGKKLSKAHGGLAHMAKGGRASRGAQKVMSLADQVRAEMAAEKAAKMAPSTKIAMQSATPNLAFPYQDRLNKVKPVYGARAILPREKADANKAAFMEPSVVKDRLYHGTKRNFTRFSPTTADSIFLTPDPTFASGFAHGSLQYKDPYSQVAHGRFSTPEAKFLDPQEQVDNANILPVRVQVRNPFDYENPEHVEALRDWMLKNETLPKDRLEVQLQHMTDPELSANWTQMENPKFQKGIKALGHDAYYTKELDTKNLGVYNPNMVKSDIGNIGTWSTKTPEITEKKGGLV